MADERRWTRGAGLARRIDGVSRRLDIWSARQSQVPELRQRVRALAEAEWGSPVEVVHLGDDVTPRFEIPGRRRDGTLKGRRLVRRFFSNIVRGVATVFLVVTAGGGGSLFAGRGSVTGPADAQAFGLVEAARSAKGAWLVFTATDDLDERRSGYPPARIAVVDLTASADGPVVSWQARTPDTPKISPARQRVRWPDGSVFQYDVTREEARAARAAVGRGPGGVPRW